MKMERRLTVLRSRVIQAKLFKTGRVQPCRGESPERLDDWGTPFGKPEVLIDVYEVASPSRR